MKSPVDRVQFNNIPEKRQANRDPFNNIPEKTGFDRVTERNQPIGGSLTMYPREKPAYRKQFNSVPKESLRLASTQQVDQR